ncbi:Hypoxic response protein 1 [bioreactor metagenome]|uniref:Hypoxic response protein 1 n=1 Tax=bioreactor metagenome TaxID=1076179 RepID=A0A644XT77_9ZZZZ
MQVRNLMNPNVVSITPGESAALAARLLCQHNVGSLPVCEEDGRLRGILTDRDIILRCIAAEEDPAQTPVREVMTRSPSTVSPDDDIREAARIMASDQIRRLPVVDHGRLVGIVALGDLARTHQFDMEASKALSEISDNVKRP